MDKKKITGIIVAAVAVIAIVSVIAVSVNKKDDTKSSLVPSQNAAQTQQEGNNDTSDTEAANTGNAPQSNAESQNNAANETANQTKQEKVKPTFMYFVSGKDEKFDETNAMLEELKGQYGEQVVFDIVNVDEHPEAIENFPVGGQTPVLIMLNTSNDICAIEFVCNDKATLEEDINKALQ